MSNDISPATRAAFIIVGLVLAAITIALLAGCGHRVEAHDGQPMPVAIPPGATLLADFGGNVTPPDEAVNARPDLADVFRVPEAATFCSTRNMSTYAYTTCSGYSGSGTRYFKVKGTAWDGCGRYIYFSSLPARTPGTARWPYSGNLIFPWRIIVAYKVDA